MKEEFTKTSLHNHFGGNSADYKIDTNGPYSFDLNFAKQKIDEASKNEYQLLGMTNANHLWADEYHKLKRYIEFKKYNICLIPGVEVNIINDELKSQKDKKYLHLIILIDPKCDVDNFSRKLDNYIISNKENSIDISQLIELVIELKSILIPHGKKQEGANGRGGLSNPGTFDDILNVKDFIPIMIEDNKYSQRKTFEVKIRSMLSEENYEWLTKSAASISSLDRIKSFSDIEEPTYIWGDASFDALFYSSVIGKSRVFREADIIEKSRYIKKIIIKDKGGALKNSEIYFSHGLNSIVGNSGSGKTLLLNLIKNKLTGKNLLNAVSTSNSNYDEMYYNSEIDIYDNFNNKISLDEINVFEGENLYRQIVSSINNNKLEILENLDAVPEYDKTKKIINDFNEKLYKYIYDNIKIKNIMKEIDKSIVKILASSEYLKANKNVENNIEYIINSSIYTDKKNNDDNLLYIKNDLYLVKKNYKELLLLLRKYKVSDDKIKDTFKDLFKKVILQYYACNNRRIGLTAKIKYSEKISEIVNEYNYTMGNRAKISLEAKQNINNESEKIINLLKEKRKIENELYVPVLQKEELVNSIKVKSEIIKLDNIKVLNVLSYDDISLFFDNVIGSSRGKMNKSLFSDYRNKTLNLYDKKSIEEFANVFIENDYYNNKDIFRFVSDKFFTFKILIKDLSNEYKDIESLSAGQLSKIYINILIDNKLKAMENNAIILYDQPDNNLEKKFILDILGKKLDELKQKYQVIITTHEPLLVINSDSNAIIFAENDPTNGKNSIHFENLSMYDVGNIDAAVDRIASLIDGSRNAIKLRNQVYGGFNL